MNTDSKFSKTSFIRFALSCQVLQFGDFTLKSGRQSPYFFNAGLFYSGVALKKLGEFYAEKLLETGVNCSHLFGPAYKGLPLATSTAVALADRGVDALVSFNRKEAKSHGEGGELIGAPIQGSLVMVDDVITAGTAFRESKSFIEAKGGQISTVIIALNRCERGQGKRSTLQEIEDQGIPVLSVITLYDLLDFLRAEKSFDLLKKLEGYQREYGYQ